MGFDTVVQYGPVLLLVCSGASGAWVRRTLRLGDMRPSLKTDLAHMLLGASGACLVYTFGAPLFPEQSPVSRFTAALFGVGCLAGFFALELYVRLLDRLPGFEGNKSRDLIRQYRKEVDTEVEKAFGALLDFGWLDKDLNESQET